METFESIDVKHTNRTGNKQADALPTLTLKLNFDEDAKDTKVVKWTIPIMASLWDCLKNKPPRMTIMTGKKHMEENLSGIGHDLTTLWKELTYFNNLEGIIYHRGLDGVHDAGQL